MDLIDRQAAIDAFPDKRLSWDTYDGYVSPHLIRCIISDIPSVQPEIIRCKDCKHRPKTDGKKYGFDVEFPDEICPAYCDDEYYNWMPDDDFYCARAERREDE